MADSSQQQQSRETTSQQTLKDYIVSDMVASTLFVMRLGTIICSLIYILSGLGLFSGISRFCYSNAQNMAFLTFTIRLVQRKKQANISAFSKEFFVLATTEDSGHYMLYTFFYGRQEFPLAIYLIPPFLYAVLSSAPYTNGMIPFLLSSLQSVMKTMNDRIASGQYEIRRFIAYTEIFLMFVVIWNAFTGYMFILAPLLHYSFLKLRYQSLRNKSVAVAFSDLRMAVEHAARHPKCPSVVATPLHKSVSFVSALAPSRPMRREA